MKWAKWSFLLVEGIESLMQQSEDNRILLMFEEEEKSKERSLSTGLMEDSPGRLMWFAGRKRSQAWWRVRGTRARPRMWSGVAVTRVEQRTVRT